MLTTVQDRGVDEVAIRQLIDGVRDGSVAADDAVVALRALPYADLGFARVDHHRHVRQGMAEAVYGPGKSPDQAARIVAELLARSSEGFGSAQQIQTPADRLLHPHLLPEQHEALKTTRELDFSYGVKGISRFRFNVYRQRGSVGAAMRRWTSGRSGSSAKGPGYRHRCLVSKNG